MATLPLQSREAPQNVSHVVNFRDLVEVRTRQYSLMMGVLNSSKTLEATTNAIVFIDIPLQISLCRFRDLKSVRLLRFRRFSRSKHQHLLRCFWWCRASWFYGVAPCSTCTSKLPGIPEESLYFFSTEQDLKAQCHLTNFPKFPCLAFDLIFPLRL